MKTYARLRNFGVPPLKVRRFAGPIKGQPVERALAILDLAGSPTCQQLHKLLRSAVANAENNNGLASQNLQVSNIIVDNGPMMKRIRPRARGRAYSIFKRSCHVTIELDLTKEALRKQATPVAAGTGGSAATGKGEKPAASKATKPAASAAKAATPAAPAAKTAAPKARAATTKTSEPKAAAPKSDAAKSSKRKAE
jgi:large subunit ribosomal protein L22